MSEKKVRDSVRTHEDERMGINSVELITHWIEMARISMEKISRCKEKGIFRLFIVSQI